MVLLKDVISFLEKTKIKYVFVGDKEESFETYCPLNQLSNSSITWVRHADALDVQQMNACKSIVLVAELGAQIESAVFPIIYAENAHRTFFRIIENFFSDLDPENRLPKFETSAIIETDKIGDSVYVGHHTYIGPDVVIGKHVSILNNVTIQGNVKIGDYTTIESGTTIGVCGFGHYWDEEGNPYVVPHLGGVVIGSHVKIGANCGIARGCLSDTVIEDFVQIDNLSHIAHNDHIMERAILTANTVIAGSSLIGENAWLAPGSLVMNGISIGKDAFMGLGSVAIKDVPEKKKTFGNPARVTGDR